VLSSSLVEYWIPFLFPTPFLGDYKPFPAFKMQNEATQASLRTFGRQIEKRDNALHRSKGANVPFYTTFCAKKMKVHVVTLCYQGYFQSLSDWITKRPTPTILPQNPLHTKLAEKRFWAEAEM
jgi:hypothetical protein